MNRMNYDRKCIQYDKTMLEKYLEDLQIVGSLSGLFSDSSTPFIHYRASENLFCNALNAINLARADVSADAKLEDKGIGIKTFLEGNKKTLQKIAEFNEQQILYKDLSTMEKIKKVSQFRNKRIQFTKSAYAINDMLYHCIVRNSDGFFLFEEPMNEIDIDSLKIISENAHTILFTDNNEEYKFDESKSTLYKRFITDEYFASVKVNILENPIEELRKIKFMEGDIETIIPEHIVLPLYSITSTGDKVVYPKSGLNLWNAGGRQRKANEVYIQHPVLIRDLFENFFPNRDESFEVTLPNGKTLSMKVCQENGKAIMSNPNTALGEWILRDILKLPEGTVVTYEMLLEIGIDSIYFQKIGNNYTMDFRPVGSYEKFIDNEI